MSGLILSDPSCNDAARASAEKFLAALDIPVAGFTDAPADIPTDSRASFLRAASWTLLIPGRSLPMDATIAYLTGDARPANILRRYLYLQFSLRHYLRPGIAVLPMTGCFLIGTDLLVVPVSPEDTVDALLPPGIWTELTGMTHTNRLRTMRGYNELPVLVRENALLPISRQGASAVHAFSGVQQNERPTLHWFQPDQEATCALADGTVCRVWQEEGYPKMNIPGMHLILHRDGVEEIIA